MGWNQIGWLRRSAESREIIEQGYTKRAGQKTDSLWGSVTPGKTGKTETRLGWGAGGRSAAVRFTRGRCWRPSPRQQSTSAGTHICLLCPASSGCSTVRSMAATLLCWGGSAEDVRMSLLLLVSKRLGSWVSRGKSHFPENIWQPIGGKLQRNLFLPGMLLLFGNKDLIFQGCQCNIFCKH